MNKKNTYSFFCWKRFPCRGTVCKMSTNEHSMTSSKPCSETYSKWSGCCRICMCVACLFVGVVWDLIYTCICISNAVFTQLNRKLCHFHGIVKLSERKTNCVVYYSIWRRWHWYRQPVAQVGWTSTLGSQVINAQMKRGWLNKCEQYRGDGNHQF